MHRKDKYSQHSSIIWSVWPNGWEFVYELSGCGFESHCSHQDFSYAENLFLRIYWDDKKTKIKEEKYEYQCLK